MTSRRSSGLTLVEVLVAVSVIAMGALAVQRLASRSARTLAHDRLLTRALLAAEDALAAARLAPPAVGVHVDTSMPHLRVERRVRATPHPNVREVRVRVVPDAARAHVELVEMVRAPAP